MVHFGEGLTYKECLTLTFLTLLHLLTSTLILTNLYDRYHQGLPFEGAHGTSKDIKKQQVSQSNSHITSHLESKLTIIQKPALSTLIYQYPSTSRHLRLHLTLQSTVQSHGRTIILLPLLQPHQIRVDPHPVDLLFLPLRRPLVHLRVQVLQVEDVSTMCEQAVLIVLLISVASLSDRHNGRRFCYSRLSGKSQLVAASLEDGGDDLVVYRRIGCEYVGMLLCFLPPIYDYLSSSDSKLSHSTLMFNANHTTSLQSKLS